MTPEQGGRKSGPPPLLTDIAYAHTAFVPPQTMETGLASFVLQGFEAGAWTSPAEGRWLIVLNDGEQRVERGNVVVVTEGHSIVAYFHVDEVVEEN
ncbi:MAG TPA: hypothetical protein VN816_08430 [Acidimicrobiales bacterium]|nr:hypothetical protein [Acidimicrobiales bacterium]